ncbi:MAG TPA: DUF6088 family protein [Rectinemataceae bacterium]|nr:DUF6088 family protein [Rectinemataceae bacterium]
MLAEKLLSRIYGMKRGWCFTPKDFLDLGSPSAIWQALSRLEKIGTIRKLMRGVYDYPEKNTFLEGYASPDPDRVARTIARGNSWNIIPDGTTALNLLGLSTQVPAEWSYLTDGQNRRYEMDTVRIVFRKRANKEATELSRDAAIVVQAIKALGKENIDERVLEKLSGYLSASSWPKIIRECRYVSGWVLDVLKQAAGRSVSKERPL